MTDLGPDRAHRPVVLPEKDAEALAERYGMHRVGQRPGLFSYIRDVWRHRHLMWTLAKGDFVATHQDNYLGLLWSIINPILLGIAYYLIFGVLIGTRGGVDNFVSFLTIGLFTFIPISVAMTAGSKSLLTKSSMMRSLNFPRALLPITRVLSEFVTNLPAFVILIPIALFSGEPVTVEWLLYPVALVVVMVMGLGLALILAPLIHAARDLANLVPLVVRLLRYTSGIFFVLDYRLAQLADKIPDWVAGALHYQPVAAALQLVRETLMAEYEVQRETWLIAGGWALGLFIVGFLVFWRGEGSYGKP